MLSDAGMLKDAIVQYIRDYFDRNCPGGSAVVGISGDINSAVAAALCVEALGKSRVIGVLTPNGIQDGGKNSLRLINALGIEHLTVGIGGAIKELTLELRGHMLMTEQTRDCLPSGVRAAVLHAVAQSIPKGGCVAETENYPFGKNELLTPLLRMTDENVRQIGGEIHALAELNAARSKRRCSCEHSFLAHRRARSGGCLVCPEFFFPGNQGSGAQTLVRREVRNVRR